MGEKVYRDYVLDLMKTMSPLLNQGIGMDINVYPCNDARNTVIQIKMNKESGSSYKIHEERALVSALRETGIDKYISPLTGVVFEGTNVFVDSVGIVYVKENKEYLFSLKTIEEDVLTLVKYRLGKL
jgi:hypothetical protein